MVTKYRLDRVQDLHFDISEVTTGGRQHNRFLLADIYQTALAAEGYFPKKPLSLMATMPANLRRKVSESCSLCIRQQAMDDLVDTAKGTLTEYKKALQEWLAANDVVFDDSGSPVRQNVADLDSNLETL